jgi:outer membrane lipoprotein LolB
MILLKFPTFRRLPVAILVLLLAACAQMPQKAVTGGGESGQAAREAMLQAQANWSFQGRVAINNNGQAGNARILWRQQGEDLDITLAAPVTRQSWRLVRTGGQARLEGIEGGPRVGPDAEALLAQATGWRIPIAALTRWVRGARADAELARVTYSAAGLPTALSEAGWAVEYKDWAGGDPPLPTRLFARQGDASVRLVIERWNVP